MQWTRRATCAIQHLREQFSKVARKGRHSRSQSAAGYLRREAQAPRAYRCAPPGAVHRGRLHEYGAHLRDAARRTRGKPANPMKHGTRRMSRMTVSKSRRHLRAHDEPHSHHRPVGRATRSAALHGLVRHAAPDERASSITARDDRGSIIEQYWVADDLYQGGRLRRPRRAEPVPNNAEMFKTLCRPSPSISAQNYRGFGKESCVHRVRRLRRKFCASSRGSSTS